VTYLFALLLVLLVVAAIAYPVIRARDRSREAEHDEEPEDLRIPRERLYEAIRELELERATGSISQEELDASRAAYEMQAASLLQQEEHHGKRRPPQPAKRPAAAKAGATGPPSVSQRLGLLIPAAIILLVGVGIGYFLGTSLTARETGMEATGSVPPGGEPVGAIPSSLEEANEAFNRGDFRRALEGYKRILENDPENPEALTQIGVLLSRGEHHDEAIRTFDRVLGIRPNFPQALFEKGLVLFQGKVQPREGVKVWEQLIETAPPENQYAVAAKQMLEQVRASMDRPGTAPPAAPSSK
jgi:tetratricopeptide (TPR) repeat protein